MSAAIVTKESLIKMLSNSNVQYVDAVIGRALVGLLQRQTKAEQFSNETAENNGVGFTGADGHSGALTAKSFMKNGKLMDWQREMWLKPNKNGLPRIAKYHKQLNEIAMEKRKA
mgnify:CR=1 FL=1